MLETEMSQDADPCPLTAGPEIFVGLATGVLTAQLSAATGWLVRVGVPIISADAVNALITNVET
jgi:hypothetical protein